MARELGGSQISALLESVPGIASVLRSPVADAMVNIIRAAARLNGFAWDDAQELVQYAVRRGLISADEGDELLGEVKGAARRKRSRRSRAGARRTRRTAAKARKKARKKGKQVRKASKARKSKAASGKRTARRAKKRARKRR